MPTHLFLPASVSPAPALVYLEEPNLSEVTGPGGLPPERAKRSEGNASTIGPTWWRSKDRIAHCAMRPERRNAGMRDSLAVVAGGAIELALVLPVTLVI